MLSKSNIPKYIHKIIDGNLEYAGYAAQHSDYYGYTFRLYGRHKIGYADQLFNDADKLIKWANRKYATSFVVRARSYYGPEMQRAYKKGLRNYVDLVITDPVAQVIGF